MTALSNQPAGFGTASGHPNYSAGGMSYFYDKCHIPEILEVFWCNAVWPFITVAKRLKGLLTCGKVYRYYKASPPKVFRGYKANQSFAFSTPSTCENTIQLGYRAYTNEKFDMIQMKEMCQSPVLLANRRMLASKALANAANADFLSWLPTQVHRCNQGSAAGVTNPYDLGTVDAPLVVGPRNIISVFSILDEILAQHNLPAGGRWTLLPLPIRTLIRNSHAAFNGQTGNGQLLPNGMCQDLGMLPCAESYVSTCMRPIKNADGKIVYPIYYGWKEAIDAAFGMEAISGEYSAMPFYAGRHLIEMITYGFATIYPEGLAVAYVTIDPDWMKQLPGVGGCC